MSKNISPEAAARSARRSTLASARLSGHEVKPQIVGNAAEIIEWHRLRDTVGLQFQLYLWSDGVVTWRDSRD